MASIQEGSVVKLSGLVGAPRLNGLEGTVQHFDRASGRWQVDLPGEGTKAIKPENLELVQQEKEKEAKETKNVKDLLPGGLIGLLFGEPSSKAASDPAEEAEQPDDIADDAGDFGDEDHEAEIHAEEEAAPMDEEEVAEGEEGHEVEEQQEAEEEREEIEDPEPEAGDHDMEEGHEGEGEGEEQDAEHLEEVEGQEEDHEAKCEEEGEEAEAAPADEWQGEEEWLADEEQGAHDQDYPDGDGFNEDHAEGKDNRAGWNEDEDDQSWGDWYGNSSTTATKGKEDGEAEKSNIYKNAAREKEKEKAKKAEEGSEDSDDEWGDWKGKGPPASATGGIDATELSSLPVKDLKQKFAEFNLRIPVGITEKAELCENLVQQMTERKQEEERQERIRERKETAYAKFGGDASGKDGKGKGPDLKGKGPCKGKGKAGGHGPANNHARPSPVERPPGYWQGGMMPPHPQVTARAKPGPKAAKGPTPPRGPPPDHLLGRGAARPAAQRMPGPIPQRPMPNIRTGRPQPPQAAQFPPRVAPSPKPLGPRAGFGRPPPNQAGPVPSGHPPASHLPPPPHYPPPRPGPPPPGPPPAAAAAARPPPPKTAASPRNAQEASKLAMERMQKQGLPAPGLLERIAMFVQRHRLADEVDVGMRLLPGKALLGLLDDPALARVLQSSRDPSEVMVREVSRIDVEAGAVVQALARSRSNAPDGRAPPPPPPPDSKSSRHEAARGRSSSCDSSLSSLEALRKALKGRSRSRSRRRKSKQQKDRHKHRSKKRGRRDKSKSRSRSRSRGRKHGRKESPKPRQPPKALKDLANDLDPDFGTSFGKQDIEDWLLNLDGGRGAMLRYLEVALKEFNDLSEIKQALLPKEKIQEGASIVKMVEPEIFTALGVESLGHRLMLARGIIALNKE